MSIVIENKYQDKQKKKKEKRKGLGEGRRWKIRVSNGPGML
jgi:hypothetical protein